MSILVNVAAEIVCIFMIYVVIKRIKANIITETQAIPWLITAIVVGILGFFPMIINGVASFFGVWYSPTIFFVIIIVLLVFIIFNHSCSISVLTNQISELSMQVTILKDEVKELRTLDNEIPDSINKLEEGRD